MYIKHSSSHYLIRYAWVICYSTASINQPEKVNKVHCYLAEVVESLRVQSFMVSLLYPQGRSQTSVYQSWIARHAFTCFILVHYMYRGFQVGWGNGCRVANHSCVPNWIMTRATSNTTPVIIQLGTHEWFATLQPFPQPTWKLASFPGLSRLQCLIACRMQKRREKAWWILPRDPRHRRHMSSRLYTIAMLGRRPILRSVLATKTRQALTENNITRTKHIRARRNISEGLPNDMCEISAVTKFS